MAVQLGGGIVSFVVDPLLTIGDSNSRWMLLLLLSCCCSSSGVVVSNVLILSLSICPSVKR